MKFRKRQRLVLLFLGLILVGGAAALVLTALKENVAFFVSPTEIAKGELSSGKHFRVGGLVVDGSVTRSSDGSVSFALTDTAERVEIVYRGILPDLFREGQGIVAQGTLRTDGVFAADEVLAKHDENYMPKEVADAIKNAGHWQQTDGGNR